MGFVMIGGDMVHTSALNQNICPNKKDEVDKYCDFTCDHCKVTVTMAVGHVRINKNKKKNGSSSNRRKGR